MERGTKTLPNFTRNSKSKAQTQRSADPAGFLKNFGPEWDDCMKEPLNETGSRSIVRVFISNCTRRHSNHWYCCCRYLPSRFNIEKAITDRLRAYEPVDSEDAYIEAIAVHDLKRLRRFLLQRYGFRPANQIASLLHQKYGVNWLWLFKDRVLPRIPLALGVGYGIVLGAFKDWLRVLGREHIFAGILTSGSLLLAFFLIYCSVRDCAGPVADTLGRTANVFAKCIVWSIILLRIGWWAAQGTELAGSYDLGVAVCLGSSSLLLAIVVQFFFAKQGSIADPL